MRVYEFDSYKDFVRARLEAMPHRGRGEFQKMAAFLGVHSALMSHVFKGEKELSLEQGYRLCRYFGLNELETECFIALLQMEKAGTHELREYFGQQVRKVKEKATQLVNRVDKEKVLSETDRIFFYSQWYHSAIRLLTSIPEFQNVDAIAEVLKMPKKRVSEIIDFLLTTGLCQEKEGRLNLGPARTYIEQSSPLVSRHHVNWRIKALSALEKLPPEELAFTSPMTISRKDFARIREKIAQLIEEVMTIMKDSESEELVCLNLDWFKVIRKEAGASFHS